MKTLTFDFETTNLDPWSGDIVCLGYKFDDDPTKVSFDRVPAEVLMGFKDPRILKIGHNIPYDLKWALVKGMEINGPLYCTKIAYLSKNTFKDARLKTLMKAMGYDTTEFKEMVDKYRPKIPKGLKRDERKAERIRLAKLGWWQFVPNKVIEAYCAMDVDGTYEIYKKMGQCSDWVHNVEFPLIYATVNMEMNGMYLDQSKVEVIHQVFLKEVKQIESQFPTYAKSKKVQACVLTSPKALREHLVSMDLSHDLSKFLTQSGEYSTDKQAMTALAQRVPVAQTILRYRALSKLVGTYTSKMRGKSILRGTFNQVGCKTWRYSSSKPNLQQIPSRSMEGLQVRSCFIARPGHKLIVADLSQIEPRVYAWRSQDPILLAVFQEGRDFHTLIAQTIYGKLDITKAERFIGKTVGLAVLYGGGVKVIQSFLQKNKVDKNLRECKAIRDSIREGFPVATAWSKDQWDLWETNGKIVTLGGRHIIKDDCYRVNPVNYSIQPTCADIMKIILLNLFRAKFKLGCTVHDEALTEVREHEAHDRMAVMKDIMENSVKLKGMPLVTDIKIVDNWAEAK